MIDRTKEVSAYKLKPCPCCGSTAKLRINDEMYDCAMWYFQVQCTSCGICGRTGGNYDYVNGHLNVVEEWNRRDGDQKLRDRIESIVDDMLYNDMSYDSVRASLESLMEDLG